MTNGLKFVEGDCVFLTFSVYPMDSVGDREMETISEFAHMLALQFALGIGALLIVKMFEVFDPY